jgi:hypothetical protein
MSQSICYVGVAFYGVASLDTQWALILSEDPHLSGPGWGSSPADTVNGGVGISWVWFKKSPAGFKPSGLFMGVIRVAMVHRSINNLKTVISDYNQASAGDRTYVRGTDDILWGSDKYVVLALLRLYGMSILRLPTLGRDSLAQFIRGRICDLLRTRCTQGSVVYPVVSLESGNLSFGHSRR